jgi:hypothetical protein
MKKTIVFTILTFCLMFVFITCEDEVTKTIDPSIQFKRGDDYTWLNDSARYLDTIKVGIMAEAGNKGNLILFEISRNDEAVQTIDINKEKLDADVIIVKDSILTENWKFFVKDKSNRADSVSLVVTLDTSGI